MEELSALDAHDYLPVLALTAEPAYKLPALKAGAKDFIAKPFDPEEALTRIHNMLEVRLLHDEARHNAWTMESLALHDALTGLANRRLLTDRISTMLANTRRNNGSIAVVYLDLDGFKQINDTLGHGVGDTLLKMVSQRLSAVVREEDTAGRVGSDEFVIALWDVNRASDAELVASKMIRSVSAPYAIEGLSVGITASAGVAHLSGSRRGRGYFDRARGRGAVHRQARGQKHRPDGGPAGGARPQLDYTRRNGERRLQLCAPPARALGRSGHAEGGVQRPLPHLH